MASLSPGTNLTSLRNGIQGRFGVNVSGSPKKEIESAVQMISSNRLPLPPLIFSSDKTMLIDPSVGLTAGDYRLLFSASSTKLQLKRVARKLKIVVTEQFSKETLKEAITKHLISVQAMEPIQISRKKTGKRTIPENFRAFENRANSGNLGNTGNRVNSGNLGNTGNRVNSGNTGNIGNRGNSGNTGNKKMKLNVPNVNKINAKIVNLPSLSIPNLSLPNKENKENKANSNSKGKGFLSKLFQKKESVNVKYPRVANVPDSYVKQYMEYQRLTNLTNNQRTSLKEKYEKNKMTWAKKNELEPRMLGRKYNVKFLNPRNNINIERKIAKKQAKIPNASIPSIDTILKIGYRLRDPNDIVILKDIFENARNSVNYQLTSRNMSNNVRREIISRNPDTVAMLYDMHKRNRNRNVVFVSANKGTRNPILYKIMNTIFYDESRKLIFEQVEAARARQNANAPRLTEQEKEEVYQDYIERIRE